MEFVPFVIVLGVAALAYFVVLPAIRKARPNTPGFFGGGGRIK